MATKIIPAQTIKTCDCCGCEINSKTSRKDGKLTLKMDALDMHGHACADGSRVLDLCDSCLWDVEKGIDAVLASKKE